MCDCNRKSWYCEMLAIFINIGNETISLIKKVIKVQFLSQIQIDYSGYTAREAFSNKEVLLDCNPLTFCNWFNGKGKQERVVIVTGGADGLRCSLCLSTSINKLPPGTWTYWIHNTVPACFAARQWTACQGIVDTAIG